MKNLTIEVEHLRRGQPRAYAPHTYESRITITGERSWDRLLKGQVKDLVKAVVHPFTEENDGSQAAYYQPRLVRLDRVSEEALTEHPLGSQREVWIACIEIPFTD